LVSSLLNARTRTIALRFTPIVERSHLKAMLLLMLHSALSQEM